MTKLHELASLGQAIWLDYVRRSFIASGELQALINDGLTGITSNPTIFEKAIAGSTDYDDALRRLAGDKSVPAARFAHPAHAGRRPYPGGGAATVTDAGWKGD